MSKRKTLATSFRYEEVRAVVALLRKLSLSGYGPNAAHVARVHAKFARMLAKSEAP